MRVEATGPASRAAMWSAYADPTRWSTWAPQITEVLAEGPLRPNLEGAVRGILGVRAHFHVISVDEPVGRWSWDVRSGPVRLRIDHEVDDGRTAVVIRGAAPIVLAYAPVARAALGRLVRLGEDRAR